MKKKIPENRTYLEHWKFYRRVSNQDDETDFFLGYRLKLLQLLFWCPYHLLQLFLRTGDTKKIKQIGNQHNLNCCVYHNIVNLTYLGFVSSFLIYFWKQYI